MSKVRVGVVGVGRMGTLHLRKFLENPEVEVVGFCEPGRERAAQIASEYGVAHVSEYSDLLFESDAVCIASPTPTHFSLARQALENGVHCLVEKPISETVAEGEMLVAIAEARGLVLQVGFVERFRFEVLTKGCPVRPARYLESHRLVSSPGREPAVDVVSDLMIHDIHLALSLVGEEPSGISAIGVAVLTPYYDLANVRLEFPGGAVANISASRISPKPMRKFRVFSQEAYTSVDFLSNSVEVAFRNGPSRVESRRMERPDLDALAGQNLAFVRAVKGVQPSLVTGRDGVLALRWSEAVRESIAKRPRWNAPSNPAFAETLP